MTSVAVDTASRPPRGGGERNVPVFCPQEPLMDLPLRTISYIADIGNMVVLMARGKMVRPRGAEQSAVSPDDRRLYRMVCHVFESEDVSSG